MTIDGPAGAGKSSVARALADRLGFRFLDTGAMYRAVTLKALRANALGDAAALGALAREADIRFEDDGALVLDGEDVSAAIRGADVTAAVSAVSAEPAVRAAMVEAQRAVARDGDLVCEGRDMGTVVFPAAEVKIYLDASPRVRAERRRRELAEKGEAPDLATLQADIERRDRADSTRAVAPLVRSPGQTYVDSSGLDRDEVIERLLRIARASIG